MSAKAIVSSALALAVLGGWAALVNAQPQTAPSDTLPTPSNPPASALPEVIPPPSQIPAAQAGLPPGSVPDPWITYDRPGCCGPFGADGPIGTEFYARNGVSLPGGNQFWQNNLNTGWQTSIGARTLLFNKCTTAAWTADAGLSYTYNNSSRPETFILNVPFVVTTFDQQTFQQISNIVPSPLPMTVRDYQRASLNLAGGREWYLWQPAYSPGRHLRFGVDMGGRWGTSRLGLNDLSIPGASNYRRLYDVFGAVFTALHADVEFPFGPGAWWLVGVRGEWNLGFSDILKDVTPGVRSNIQDVNILLTTGFRY